MNTIRVILCCALLASASPQRIPGPGGKAHAGGGGTGCGGGGGGITCVAAISFASGSSAGGTSTAVNMTGASELFVWATLNPNGGAGTTWAPSDSSGNSYTCLTQGLTGFAQQQMCYAESPTVSSSMTFTATCTGATNCYATFVAMGFSGMASSSTYQGTAAFFSQSSGTFSTITSNSVTPPSSGHQQLVLSGMGLGFTQTVAFGSISGGFALPSNGYVNNVFSAGLAYLVETSGGVAAAPTWTMAANLATSSSSQNFVFQGI